MSGDGVVHGQESWYARTLRLRHLRPGGLTSFLFFECMIAGALLLALAELVSWWAVAVLPVAVAAMVKVNDLVAGALSASGRARSASPQSRQDHMIKVNTPVYAVPSVGESAAILRTRSSRVYMSRARVAAEAAMEAAPMEAAGPEAPQR